MLTKADIRKIAEDVLINNKKLNSCIGPHYFKPVMQESSTSTWQQRYKCTRCGGEISAINNSWYQKGINHGRMRHA